ncbi:MAG: hypothetical protein ABR911_02595 [Syntrophales bacterium]|jgi:hypothetical protein
MVNEGNNKSPGIPGVPLAASQALDTPVLMLLFNRPDVTRQVFESICRANPKRLFVKAHGPRAHKAVEVELSAGARAIGKQIDWQCDATCSYNTLLRVLKDQCCVTEEKDDQPAEVEVKPPKEVLSDSL